MLANRLKILLAERDLTIKDVMSAIGLTRPSVSNMVNNPFANVSTKNIDKLCNYLEITPAEFFDYSGWIFSFSFSEKEPSISVTMRSGKMARTFQLLLEFNYLDPRDPNNNVTEDYEEIIASNPNGYDESFASAYKELSPLFKHQVENELFDCARKALKIYHDKDTIPCFFYYYFKDELVLEGKLN